MTWLTNMEDTHALSPIHFNGKCTLLIRLQIITSVRKMLYELNGCEWLACRYVPLETQTLKSVQFLLRPCYVLATPRDQWGTDGVPMRYQWTDSEGSLTCTLGQNGPKIVVERTGERERDSIRFFKDHQKIPRCCFFLLFSPVVMEMMFPSIVPSRVHNEGKYQRRKSLCLRPEYSSSPCPDLHPPLYSLNGKKIKLKRPINQWCTQRAEMC